MPKNLTQKLIDSHQVGGHAAPGAEIGLRIDQTLTQDATGTMVMLELEAIGVERVATELSVQYVDHNLIQGDQRNPDDHLFLRRACQRFGIWYSPPGNGISHPVHMERFGKPGATLLGSDSHTQAAGALGMLGIGAGGIEVALAMAGEPFHTTMPRVWGIELVGSLPEWSSAKDVILELLRRHGVDGAANCVLEYHGAGVAALSAMDRHVLANMGTELGATSSVFPSDAAVEAFLRSQGRAEDYQPLAADKGAHYDRHELLDLSQVEPMIALPSSPGKVRRVRDVAGEPIYQSYIGSSANPGYLDFAIAARMVSGRRTHERVSFDVNPSTRQVLATLIRDSHLGTLVSAGARIHQAGCNGCIGMGQAPATGRVSLRTVPRNFPGRSGTPEDLVHLVSPLTATASAITGRITDPRDLGIAPPAVDEASDPVRMPDAVVPPPQREAPRPQLVKGPGIRPLPVLQQLPDRFELPVLLTMGDDVSTDEIMPAGAGVLPYRSDVEAISEFCFDVIDPSYAERAQEVPRDGHAIVGGRNYGQGASREHSALAPRFLGLKVVIAESFSRIHRQNLVNFGVLPLTFAERDARSQVEQSHVLVIEDLHAALASGDRVRVAVKERDTVLECHHGLSSRQRDIMMLGGVINWTRRRKGVATKRS